MAEIKNGSLIFKVATYNIAAESCCPDDPGAIARDIAEAGADVVGLQEVDLFLRRSGEKDMAAEIAANAGYPYYRFIRAIDYKGGQYGTAILSKHPIERLELIDLKAVEDEGRSMGRFVINILGERINYFNTHLSYIAGERLAQIDQVAAVLDNYPSYVITADFNTNDFGLFDRFHGHRLAINAESEHYKLCPGGAGIDNIIMTEDFECNEQRLGNDVHSDHRMLSAVLIKKL